MSEQVLGPDYAAPLLRIARSMSLEEDIKLAVGEAQSPERLVAAIRGSKLGALLPSTATLDDVELAAWKYYSSIMDKLAPLYTIAPSIYKAYSLPLILRDIARIVLTIAGGGEVKKEELAAPENRIVSAILRASSEHGYRGLLYSLQRQGFNTLYGYLRTGRPERRLLDLYMDLELVVAFREAVDKYGDSPEAQHLCYRLDLYAARAATSAVFSGDVEAVRALEKTIDTCLINRASLVSAVSEASPERLVAVLQSTPYARGGASRAELMELYCHLIRKYSRARLARSLAYDPTSPGYAAAVLELILLDVEDVIALTVLSNIGGPKELLGYSLSIQV